MRPSDANLLKQIIAEYGWPGIRLVGPDGADAAQRAQVDARRKNLGLPSMAEMARERGKQYQRLDAQSAPTR